MELKMVCIGLKLLFIVQQSQGSSVFFFQSVMVILIGTIVPISKQTKHVDESCGVSVVFAGASSAGEALLRDPFASKARSYEARRLCGNSSAQTHPRRANEFAPTESGPGWRANQRGAWGRLPGFFLPLAKAAALPCSLLVQGLEPSLARGGRPVCWVRRGVPPFLLPAGVEFFRRALW